jgi:UDPglucose 6-dehydrogenase
MAEIYRPLYLLETPIIRTNWETAELIKYASNAFLATKLSFINEMANLCERVGADVQVVARGMGLDGRIGTKFLHAGPGFGGSCFPKDTMALASIARENGMEARVVQATIEVNLQQRKGMVERVRRALVEIRGKQIAILGLAFKPNTDDIRNSPSIYLIGELLKLGARIRAYDPMAMENARRALNGAEFTPDPYSACQEADLAVIMTEWNELRELDMERIRGLLKRPILLDAKNIYNPGEMRRLGFTYYSIGRG